MKTARFPCRSQRDGARHGRISSEWARHRRCPRQVSLKLEENKGIQRYGWIAINYGTESEFLSRELISATLGISKALSGGLDQFWTF